MNKKMVSGDSILIKQCQECGRELQIWKTHSGTVLGIRCPDCFQEWELNNKLF